MRPAPSEGLAADNVLAFVRVRQPTRPAPQTRWSESARHIIICVDDAFPCGTVRNLQAARAEDCFTIVDAALDADEGTGHLGIRPIREGLELALFNGGPKFEMISFCIAPTHAHVLIRESADFSLDETVKLWKEKALSGSSVRQTSGSRVWAPGYFDTVLSDGHEIRAAKMAIDYHWANAPAGRGGGGSRRL